jgi:hypothetical protein
MTCQSGSGIQHATASLTAWWVKAVAAPVGVPVAAAAVGGACSWTGCSGAVQPEPGPAVPCGTPAPRGSALMWLLLPSVRPPHEDTARLPSCAAWPGRQGLRVGYLHQDNSKDMVQVTSALLQRGRCRTA